MAIPGHNSFNTAWSPQLPVIQALSALLPELCFRLEFHEEFDDDPEFLIFENGAPDQQSPSSETEAAPVIS